MATFHTGQPGSIGQKEYENLVREGITAAKNGQRALASRLLHRAKDLRPNDARPWLWLTATTDDLHEQRDYLERALVCNPHLDAARKGLARLNEKLGEATPPSTFERGTPAGAGNADGVRAEARSASPSDDTLIEAETEVFECPNCGWRLSFDPEASQLYCESCGHTLDAEEALAADSVETPLVKVMDTARAHAWAVTQHRVACEKCGAITVQETVQQSGQCPYCGHHHLVRSTQLRELIDPQAVALFKVKEAEALRRARAWLNRGLFAPDDLGEGAERLELRPAYYPFWTFDGAIEVKWSCLVREGSAQQARWEYRSGAHTEFFDDVLVPGVTALKGREVASIEPFNLKDVVEFAPAHLAGWPTLSYDRSMSDASLLAREKVIKTVRRRLAGQIEPGKESKDMQISPGNWTGMTYKHVLLPLWVGTYHYRGEEYHVLVNGQTGKVGGLKPKDPFKVAGIWLFASLGVVLLIALLTWLALAFGDDLVRFLTG